MYYVKKDNTVKAACTEIILLSFFNKIGAAKRFIYRIEKVSDRHWMQKIHPLVTYVLKKWVGSDGLNCTPKTSYLQMAFRLWKYKLKVKLKNEQTHRFRQVYNTASFLIIQNDNLNGLFRLVYLSHFNGKYSS